MPDGSAFPMNAPIALKAIKTDGGAPTVVPGTGAGSGASISLDGDNISGTITLVQGTGGIAGGQIMVMTLADGMSFNGNMRIQFSAANANFASVLGNIFATTTSNTATLMLQGIALTAGSTYKGYYQLSGK